MVRALEILKSFQCGPWTMAGGGSAKFWWALAGARPGISGGGSGAHLGMIWGRRWGGDSAVSGHGGAWWRWLLHVCFGDATSQPKQHASRGGRVGARWGARVVGRPRGRAQGLSRWQRDNMPRWREECLREGHDYCFYSQGTGRERHFLRREGRTWQKFWQGSKTTGVLTLTLTGLRGSLVIVD
jgi:hypothetical protein